MNNVAESKVAHTPIPWEFIYGSIYKQDGRGFGEEGLRIALMDREESRTTPCERDSNARFIVQACNSHYDLLEACQDAFLLAHPCEECGEVELLGAGLARCSCADRPWDWRDVAPVKEGWESCRQAIVKATGGQP